MFRVCSPYFILSTPDFLLKNYDSLRKRYLQYCHPHARHGRQHAQCYQPRHWQILRSRSETLENGKREGFTEGGHYHFGKKKFPRRR